MFTKTDKIVSKSCKRFSLSTASQPLHRNPDHISDHKQNRNTWKQRKKERTRASFTERKAAEMAVKCQKNGFLTVRDQEKTKEKRPGGAFFEVFPHKARSGRSRVYRGDATWFCQVGATMRLGRASAGSNPVTPTRRVGKANSKSLVNIVFTRLFVFL